MDEECRDQMPLIRRVDENENDAVDRNTMIALC
jgi:hypothetical protein